MTAVIDGKRLAELRAAAEVGIRMSGLQPQTVHVRPDELAALVEEVYLARAQERPHAGVACRKCGCTDTDCAGCVERTGAPCFWVERDLCSACCDQPPQLRPAELLARGLCVRHGAPAAMVMMLDPAGALHVGCAAVDHPITTRFVALVQSIDVAIERAAHGADAITREKALEIARRCAKAKPQSYYTEPFEPHEWVVDAIIQGATELPPSRAACVHCKQEVSGVDDVAAIREHSMTCSASPVVQELQRQALLLERALNVADTLVLELAGSGATPRKLDALDELAAIRKEAGQS